MSGKNKLFLLALANMRGKPGFRSLMTSVKDNSQQGKIWELLNKLIPKSIKPFPKLENLSIEGGITN